MAAVADVSGGGGNAVAAFTGVRSCSVFGVVVVVSARSVECVCGCRACARVIREAGVPPVQNNNNTYLPASSLLSSSSLSMLFGRAGVLPIVVEVFGSPARAFSSGHDRFGPRTECNDRVTPSESFAQSRKTSRENTHGRKFF